MSEFLTALAAAFGVVFIAELGDKTQLLALAFGSRHSLRRVAAGLTLGYATASLLAVAVGGLLGANLPQRPIEIIGGLVFVAFAVRAVFDDDAIIDDDGGSPSVGAVGAADPARGARGFGRVVVRSSVVATIALTILIAEMGDKTQIATATLAARSDPVGTWIGATAGEVASGMIGAVAGTVVGDRISSRVLRLTSAALFALFGVAMLIGWP